MFTDIKEYLVDYVFKYSEKQNNVTHQGHFIGVLLPGAFVLNMILVLSRSYFFLQFVQFKFMKRL